MALTKALRKDSVNWWDKDKYNRIGRVYGRLTVLVYDEWVAIGKVIKSFAQTKP